MLLDLPYRSTKVEKTCLLHPPTYPYPGVREKRSSGSITGSIGYAAQSCTSPGAIQDVRSCGRVEYFPTMTREELGFQGVLTCFDTQGKHKTLIYFVWEQDYVVHLLLRNQAPNSF